MPTPVSTARQCLTEEAANALDAAVTVARGRSHAQTSSLHAVSSLLSSPSSILHEACSRACSSPRRQLRALEVSMSVSLERFPKVKMVDDPPVGNSLMAAIKRAQASQRRNPEMFCASLGGVPASLVVRVEMQQFVLSILDDPIVSRVFGEVGLRSYDVKMMVLRPGFSKSRCPPLFLCNLSDSGGSRRGFSFPFSGYLMDGDCSGSKYGDGVDEDSRRIGEVLLQSASRNPLLVGIHAGDGLRSFMEWLRRRKGGVLNDVISGLRLMSIENEVFEFVSEGGNDEMMKMKFKEVDDVAEGCELLVNYGDLRVLAKSGSMDRVGFVVSELSRLVEVHGRRLWLIGAAADDDTYRMFVDRFPTIDKDWDLQLLPITSSRTYSMGGGYPKSSLLGSFVPFGGFFSSPSELEEIRSTKVQFTGRCSICNESYKREVSAAQKEESTSSISSNSSANIPSWLQKAECRAGKTFGTHEAKDEKIVSAARFMGLQKKWNDICHRLHFSASSTMSVARSQVPGFQNASGGKQNLPKPRSLEAGAFSCAGYVVQGTKNPLEMTSIQKSTDSVCKVSQPLDCMVGKSSISVTTELQLGVHFAPEDKGLKEKDFHKHFTGSLSSESSSTDPSVLPQSISHSIPHLREYDSNDSKQQLYGALSDDVCWQKDAIYSISQVISRFRSGHGKSFSSRKGNIWLSFLGPDKVGKRKTAVALSEKLYGSRANLIAVDLSPKSGSSSASSLFLASNLVSSDVKVRGLMIVDYIAGELKGKPNSIVLLEDIGNADIVLQNSLSRALKTGKFPNSHGKEISISNNIFVMTSSDSKVVNLLSGKPSPSFPEERVFAARDLQMRIVVEDAPPSTPDILSSNIIIIGTQDVQIHASKLKRILSDNSDFNMPKRLRNEPTLSLDLNLPVKEMEEDNGECHSCYTDDTAENSKAWLEEIFGLLDGIVAFQPFDFDSLAEKILMDLRVRFHEIFGSSSFLEIEVEVIVQIIAAAWLSDSKMAMVDWMEQVLCRSFLEVKQKWSLSDKNVMKLVTCEGLPVNDHAPGVHLPARININ